MARTILRAGMELDFATPGEVEQITRNQLHQWAEQERNHARGIKKLRRSTLLSTPAGTRVSLHDALPISVH